MSSLDGDKCCFVRQKKIVGALMLYNCMEAHMHKLWEKTKYYKEEETTRGGSSMDPDAKQPRRAP